jgi:hypothetical protein
MSRGSPSEGSLASHGNLRRAAVDEYSIGNVARFAVLVPLLTGAILLIVAEFVTVREIHIVTVVPPGGTETGGGLHGYALGIVGLAVLPMSFGAVVRGARPAAIALVVLALVAWAIVLFVDRPALDDAGIFVRNYELAEARPATGFYLECAGAALVLVGAVAALLLSPGSSARASRGRGRPRSARAPRRRARADMSPPRGDAAGPPPQAE